MNKREIRRVPADYRKPFKHWAYTVELPPDENGKRQRKTIQDRDRIALTEKAARLEQELMRLKTRNALSDTPTDRSHHNE